LSSDGTSPMNRGNDGTVRERERPFLEGLDRYIVAELNAQLLALTACSREYRSVISTDTCPSKN
jgi:hypothetical protein